jgi:hypothetical protein
MLFFFKIATKYGIDFTVFFKKNIKEYVKKQRDCFALMQLSCSKFYLFSKE